MRTQEQKVADLWVRYKAAPYGSKERRHLRRAYERALARSCGKAAA